MNNLSQIAVVCSAIMAFLGTLTFVTKFLQFYGEYNKAEGSRNEREKQMKDELDRLEKAMSEAKDRSDIHQEQSTHASTSLQLFGQKLDLFSSMMERRLDAIEISIENLKAPKNVRMIKSAD